MADDMEKLMDKKKEKKEPKYLEDEDTVEVACCGAFSYRCSAIFIGWVLVLEFFILLIELYFVATNDYFDMAYQVFYAFFLIWIGVAALSFLIYICNTENMAARS